MKAMRRATDAKRPQISPRRDSPPRDLQHITPFGIYIGSTRRQTFRLCCCCCFCFLFLFCFSLLFYFFFSRFCFFFTIQTRGRLFVSVCVCVSLIVRAEICFTSRRRDPGFVRRFHYGSHVDVVYSHIVYKQYGTSRGIHFPAPWCSLNVDGWISFLSARLKQINADINIYGVACCLMDLPSRNYKSQPYMIFVLLPFYAGLIYGIIKKC